MIGMTTYYDLTAGRSPSLPTLMEAWKPIQQKILTWQKKIGKPILFTEVGWPNQITCAQYPWDYYRSPDKPDPQAQANCFDAFFRTWSGRPEVAGVVVWEWRSFPGQKTGPEDTSYVPCDKPAMEIIAEYLAAKPGKYLAASLPASAPAEATAGVAEIQGDPADAGRDLLVDF
jgi:hypothetical protein